MAGLRPSHTFPTAGLIFIPAAFGISKKGSGHLPHFHPRSGERQGVSPLSPNQESREPIAESRASQTPTSSLKAAQGASLQTENLPPKTIADFGDSSLVPLSPLRPIFTEILLTSLAVEEEGAELVGMTVQMDLPELGLTGEAILTNIRSAPAIEPPADHLDTRQVVTATFHHSSGDVIDLVLADEQPGERLGVSPPCANTCDFPKTEHLKPKTIGEAEPESIGTTSNHPFWSVDRQEFVQAGSLEIGERLQTLSGDVKVVQQKLPRPGPQPVFNLEVHNEHVYFVGEDGVLVHNSCDDILIDNNILSNVARGDADAISFMTKNRGKLLVDTQVKLEFIQGSTRSGLSGRRPIDLIDMMNEYGIRSVKTASRTDALAVMAMNSARTVLRDDDFIVATAKNLGVRFASGDKRATITAIRNGMDARYFNFSEGNVVHRYAKGIKAIKGATTRARNYIGPLNPW